jgi:hypothetical protein
MVESYRILKKAPDSYWMEKQAEYLADESPQAVHRPM